MSSRDLKNTGKPKNMTRPLALKQKKKIKKRPKGLFLQNIMEEEQEEEEQEEQHVFFVVGRTSWFQTSFRLIRLKNSLFHSYDWGDSLPFIAASYLSN